MASWTSRQNNQESYLRFLMVGNINRGQQNWSLILKIRDQVNIQGCHRERKGGGGVVCAWSRHPCWRKWNAEQRRRPCPGDSPCQTSGTDLEQEGNSIHPTVCVTNEYAKPNIVKHYWFMFKHGLLSKKWGSIKIILVAKLFYQFIRPQIRYQEKKFVFRPVKLLIGIITFLIKLTSNFTLLNS